MEEILKKFRFKDKIHMRWSDLDELGHVNNAVYLTYFEQGRIFYLRESVQLDWSEVGLILANVVINFREPLFIADEPYIYIRCVRLGTKSFELAYVIVDEKPEQPRLIAEGTTVMVVYDYQQQASVTIPDTIREKFKLYEKHLAN